MAEDGQVHRSTRFGKLPEQLILDTTITDGATRLYAYMHLRFARYKTNDDDQKTIADALGVSERTVAKRLDELAARDWIVVIERDMTDTGQYQTNYYHVFEVAAQGALFRKNYRAHGGEKMQPKPGKIERKTRKGKGGKPAHHRNSSSEGEADDTTITEDAKNGATVGTQVPTAIGTQVPTKDSRAKDSRKSIKNPVSPEGDTHGPEKPEPPKQKASRKRDELYDAVVEVWPALASSGKLVGLRKNFLTGKCAKKNGKWHEFQLEQAATPEEITGFGKWFAEKYPNCELPEKPDTIANNFAKYRLARQNGAGQSPSDKSLAAYPDAKNGKVEREDAA